MSKNTAKWAIMGYSFIFTLFVDKVFCNYLVKGFFQYFCAFLSARNLVVAKPVS